MSEKKINVGLIGMADLSIETLMGLPRNCIYALVEKDKKRMQVYSTKDMVGHILETIREIRVSGEYSELRGDLSNVIICILEIEVDEKRLRQRQSYWIEEHRNEGYKMYKDLCPVKYNIHIETEVVWDTLEYLVFLRNTRKDHQILVGRFTKRREMKKWIDTYYKDGRVSEIVYKVSK